MKSVKDDLKLIVDDNLVIVAKDINNIIKWFYINSNQYIPFRNSPLTKILRSSLGGNSRTLVIKSLNIMTILWQQMSPKGRFIALVTLRRGRADSTALSRF